MSGLLATINWHTFFFWLYAAGACGFGLAVLLTSNVVRMAFFLVISLAATAGLFLLAGAHFVGAMQIMIYVGGTLVLLIFGVMLTAQSAFISMKTSGGEWVLAAIIGSALLALLAGSAFSVKDWRTVRDDQAQLPLSESEWAAQIGMGLVGPRVDATHPESPPQGQGLAGYMLPFEVIGIHLLVVLIGAAYLARSRMQMSESV